MSFKFIEVDSPCKILIIGALGQIGSVLTERLRLIHGESNVIASDIKLDYSNKLNNGPFEVVDATNYNRISEVINQYSIDTIYLMAAMLSASAEKKPEIAWHLNMQSLLNVLNLGKAKLVKKIFWPSSIAVFGPSTPKDMVPQVTVKEPTTIYGISKLAGERWCEYYHNIHGVDIRSIRYPGIIGWQSLPGGGTTDYAVDIFHKAVSGDNYRCFLNSKTKLPMMFIDDAIRATIEIMKTESKKITINSSYNLAAFSFSAYEISREIQKFYPEFSIDYEPDFRQIIADSWPDSIDDFQARMDWGWSHEYDMNKLCETMFNKLKI